MDILFNYASDFITWNHIEIKDVLIISDYYQAERYPGPKYFIPERDEINRLVQTAERIIEQVQKHIDK